MNKETREQIEKEAVDHVEMWYGRDNKNNKSIAGANYIRGAIDQHPKAWNAAIGEALSETWKLFDTSDDKNKPIIHQVTKILQALKLDPNQA